MQLKSWGKNSDTHISACSDISLAMKGLRTLYQWSAPNATRSELSKVSRGHIPTAFSLISAATQSQVINYKFVHNLHSKVADKVRGPVIYFRWKKKYSSSIVPLSHSLPLRSCSSRKEWNLFTAWPSCMAAIFPHFRSLCFSCAAYSPPSSLEQSRPSLFNVLFLERLSVTD